VAVPLHLRWDRRKRKAPRRRSAVVARKAM